MRAWHLCAATLLMAGCVWGGVKYDGDEVARINVGVTIVAPWDDYVDALKPQFELSAAQALDKVLPKTSAREQSVTDTLSGSLGIGFRPHTETTHRETSGSTTTTTKVEDRGVPDAPTPTLPTASAAGQLAAAAGDIALDPVLQYTSATALYQEVVLLNRALKDAVTRSGMKPYIIRLQVGVVPYRRDLELDAFTTLSFFLDDETRARVPKGNGVATDKDGIVVVPLLVTDALERINLQLSEQMIRQFALSLAAVTPTFGAEGALGKAHDELNRIRANDLNSLMTIGRVTDNTILVRLGAAAQGSAKFVMVPRTHNITAVILVPESIVPNGSNGRAVVTVSVNTELRSARDGSVVGNALNLDSELASILGDRVKYPYLKNLPTDSRERSAFLIKTRKAIYENDFTSFKEDVLDHDWVQKHDPGLTDRLLTGIWTQLANALGRNIRTAHRFELPQPPKVVAPPSQTVLLQEDDKGRVQAALVGGKNLSARMQAYLCKGACVGEPAAKCEDAGPGLFASSTTVTNGTSPTFSFPAFRTLNWTTAKAGEVANLEKKVELRTCNPAQKYTALYLMPPVKDKDATVPAVTLAAITKVIKEAAGTGSVQLRVEFGEKPIAEGALLKVTNADLLSATTLTGTGLGFDNSYPKVTTSQVIRLNLGNLDAAHPVRIVASPYKTKAGGGKETLKEPEALVVPVEHQPAKSD